MAFDFYRSLNAPNAPVTELITAAAGTYTVGEALAFSGGSLAAATGATKPEFVSAYAGTLAAAGKIPVTPVNGQEFKTVFSVTPTSVVPGTKVTIDATGTKVTATTTSGVAEVIDMLGATAAGDAVLVKF